MGRYFCDFILYFLCAFVSFVTVYTINIFTILDADFTQAHWPHLATHLPSPDWPALALPPSEFVP